MVLYLNMGHNGLLFFFCNCFAYLGWKRKVTCAKFPGFTGWKNQERLDRNCGNFQPGLPGEFWEPLKDMKTGLN